MHRTTNWRILQVLIVLGVVIISVRGNQPIEQDSWLIQPVPVQWGRRMKRRGRQRVRCRRCRRVSYWQRLGNSWHIALVRSLLMWVLWQISGQVGPDWLQCLPWLVWMLPDDSDVGHWLKQLLWQAQRLVILGYLGVDLVVVVGAVFSKVSYPCFAGMGCLVVGSGAETQVNVERQADESYLVRLDGHFTLQVDGKSRFRIRLLMVFLGLLQSENDHRASRRTRDKRTPFLRQEQLASWFGVPQERVSQYTKYWLQGDWADLLSLKSAEVLTGDLISRIVTVLATFPTWKDDQAYRYLHQQGVKVTHAQVEQAAEQSGWRQLQAALLERYELNGAGFHLRETWLVQQLLTQVQRLLTQLETGQGPTPEEHCHLADLQALAASADALPQPPLPARPWLQQVEQVVFGQWEEVSDEGVRCTYCGSSDVAPKSKTPRWKKFYDQDGNHQKVAVYRYYCHNSQCSKKSFTYFPAGLLPYSPYRTQVHLLALQMYSWGYSTYRRTGTALGVYSMTVWRWVSAWGHDLLPVAALFGVVKSSGVIGVDEKYVLVPKNDKPEGKMSRWMYVYLAVDIWTYDLLHIAIYPYNNQNSAKAFLLALRAKGYHPTVVVTDLRQDYGPTITQVFPNAEHHECIFHALQNVQKYVKDIYGTNYAQEHPEAQHLKQQIYAIFDTRSPSEAQQRYQQVLTLKEPTCQALPEAVILFDFLERHWPKLVNGIGSNTIPTTNNTVELVIRRFDQHYQNFCGFDNIQSAQCYLGVFEKVYRFTPFSQDAQKRIRGKSPLQLAGYDISDLPMAAICSGLSFDWPTEVNLVPN